MRFSKSTPDSNGAEDLVARSEHALEQLELFREKLEDPFDRRRFFGSGSSRTTTSCFLAVPMTPSDALLDALGVSTEGS